MSISCQKKSETTTESNQPKDSITTISLEPVEPKTAFKKTVSYKTISFDITKSGDTLTIQPSGFESDNTKVIKTIEGTVSNIEVDDINTDGSPELMIYITS